MCCVFFFCCCLVGWLVGFSFVSTVARMKVLMIDVSFQFDDLFQFVSQYLTDVWVHCVLFCFFVIQWCVTASLWDQYRSRATRQHDSFSCFTVNTYHHVGHKWSWSGIWHLCHYTRTILIIHWICMFQRFFFVHI